MKKIITLTFFGCAMFFAVQNSQAQSTAEMNSIASAKTIELRKTVKFDSDLRENVYQAFKAYENQIKALNEDTADSTTYAEKKARIEGNLIGTLKEVLGELYLLHEDYITDFLKA
ncbi:hypothetical protein [Mangrovimonas aestuarii]|uniref:hypothetical protein n=1 Tax=Mangrovimonas aestuarii TaxID=3018443 RepID=UPI0023795587|nr:hypothetical protein [Mangrovimonas aestuarii]